MSPAVRYHARPVALAILVALGSPGCGSTAPAPVDDGLAVLFIGNSLTATNDLPAMVDALADAAGLRRFRVESVTVGGASLEDHWNGGAALEAVDRGGWDVVVLQQGPSSVEANRLHLIEWSRRFAGRIRARGARPALYMVWPQAGGDWDAVSRAYTDAALAVDGLLFPAGEALRAIDAGRPLLPVFAADRFHPTRVGTYLAALVIVGALAERSTEGLTVLRPLVDISPPDATALERAADHANQDHGLP